MEFVNEKRDLHDILFKFLENCQSGSFLFVQCLFAYMARWWSDLMTTRRQFSSTEDDILACIHRKVYIYFDVLLHVVYFDVT